MKLFRLMSTMTIVAALAATMAVSASAMTASYADDTVSVAGLSEKATGVDSYTIMVTTAQKGASHTEGDIYFIDEAANISSNTVGTLPAGKYYVRVGGQSTADYEVAEFTVAPAATAAVLDQTFAEDTESAKATTYTADATAPTGLTPYWTADNANEDLKAIDGTWASVESAVKFVLIVEGEVQPVNPKLIWK